MAAGDPLPTYVPPRGAGDHALALHALSIVRSEMAGMTYRSIDGVRDNLQVAAQMLDAIEGLIKHHGAAQRHGAL